MFHRVKELVGHASIYSAASLLQKGVGFFMIPVYTYYLSPHDYGVLELIDLFIVLATMLAGMGLGNAIIRFYHAENTDHAKREVISTALFGVLGLVVVLFAGLQSFPSLFSKMVFDDDSYTLYFKIIAFTVVLQTLATVPESLLLAQKKSKIFSTITLVTFVSYLTLNIFFIAGLKMGVMGMLLSTLITKILNTSLNYWVTRSNFGWTFSVQKFTAMAKFGLPLIPASIAMLAIHYADRLFVQRYGDPDDLGLYSLGYKFGMILSVLISQPIFYVFNTLRFEMLDDDDPAQSFGRLFTYIFIVMVYAALGIIVLSHEVIQILAPNEYQGAATVVTPIVISYVFFGAQNFFTSGMFIGYKTSYMSAITMGTAVLNIGFNYALVPSFGIQGAAVSTLLTFALLAAATYYGSQRVYPMTLEAGRLVKVTLAAALLYAVCAFVGGNVWLAILIKLLILGCFVPLLVVLRFFAPEEIAKFRDIVRRLAARAFGQGHSGAGV